MRKYLSLISFFNSSPIDNCTVQTPVESVNSLLSYILKFLLHTQHTPCRGSLVPAVSQHAAAVLKPYQSIESAYNHTHET